MAAMLTLGLTAACVHDARGPMPVTQGPQAVRLDGAEYAVAVAPGSAGVSLTRAGAVQVPGNTITVSGGAMAQDTGAVAKRAAKQGCEQAGGRFNGAALGRYAGQGTWAFAGGCA